jgi:hypothetical protein
VLDLINHQTPAVPPAQRQAGARRWALFVALYMTLHGIGFALAVYLAWTIAAPVLLFAWWVLALVGAWIVYARTY